MNDFKNLQKRIVEFRDKRDWQQFHNAKDLSISIVLESGELLEHFQWKNPDEVKSISIAEVEEIAEEMADIQNYLILLAHELKVDLINITEKKLHKSEKKYPADKAKGNHRKYTGL